MLCDVFSFTLHKYVLINKQNTVVLIRKPLHVPTLMAMLGICTPYTQQQLSTLCTYTNTCALQLLHNNTIIAMPN